MNSYSVSTILYHDLTVSLAITDVMSSCLFKIFSRSHRALSITLILNSSFIVCEIHSNSYMYSGSTVATDHSTALRSHTHWIHFPLMFNVDIMCLFTLTSVLDYTCPRASGSRVSWVYLPKCLGIQTRLKLKLCH